jgi:hypothetical protein
VLNDFRRQLGRGVVAARCAARVRGEQALVDLAGEVDRLARDGVTERYGEFVRRD